PVELPAAVVGDDDAIRADAGRGARILRIEYALDDERSLPAGTDPIQILPADGGIEIDPEPAHVVIQAAGLAQDRLQIAEPVGTAMQAHVPHPTGLPECLQHPAQRRPRT